MLPSGLQGQTECRFPEYVRRLSARSLWNSAHLFQPGGHIVAPNRCIQLITAKGQSTREGPLQPPCSSCRLQSSPSDHPCRGSIEPCHVRSSATMLTDFLVLVLIDVVIGLIMLIIRKSSLVSLSYHVTKVNNVLHPELNKGPADLQSAALTTGLCTLEICVQIQYSAS